MFKNFDLTPLINEVQHTTHHNQISAQFWHVSSLVIEYPNQSAKLSFLDALHQSATLQRSLCSKIKHIKQHYVTHVVYYMINTNLITAIITPLNFISRGVCQKILMLTLRTLGVVCQLFCSQSVCSSHSLACLSSPEEGDT